MLSETIKQINETEAKAQQIVLEAKAKAASIVETAGEQAKQTRREALSKARSDALAARKQAEQEGERERTEYAAAVQAELMEESQQALDKADAAVEVILSELL